jgi:hypothetical protein
VKLGFITNAAEAERQMAATLAMTQRAIQAGMQEATESAKQGLRDMTAQAFRSNKLPKTWQSKLYGKTSFNPAGLIYSKAPELMRAFSEGVTIRSDKGFFLAIPTEDAPKTGTDGKRINPSNFPYQTWGRLRFVYRRGGPSLLVVDNLRPSYSRKTGELRRFRKATDKSVAAGKTATVVMFILLPQVTLKKRIDPEPIVRAAGDSIPADINKHLESVV